MRRLEIIGWVLVLIASVGTILAAVAYEKVRTIKGGYIDVEARSPQVGNWNPREIHLKVGKLARIRIKNIETVSHGFAIPALGVGVSEIKPGHVEIVEFTPDRVGEFPFMCTVWCSQKHMEMNGKIIVTP